MLGKNPVVMDVGKGLKVLSPGSDVSSGRARGPLLRVECDVGARPKVLSSGLKCEPTGISSSLST